MNSGVVKVSVVLFYRRIFAIQPFKIASAVVIGIVIAWTVAYTIVMATQCVPARIFWDRFETEYGSDCLEVDQVYKSFALTDLIVDILVLSLPYPFVWMLNMPWKRKIAVVDIFLLGTVYVLYLLRGPRAQDMVTVLLVCLDLRKAVSSHTFRCFALYLGIQTITSMT